MVHTGEDTAADQVQPAPGLSHELLELRLGLFCTKMPESILDDLRLANVAIWSCIMAIIACICSLSAFACCSASALLSAY